MLTTGSKDRLTDMKDPLGNAGILLTPGISNLLMTLVRPGSHQSLKWIAQGSQLLRSRHQYFHDS